MNKAECLIKLEKDVKCCQKCELYKTRTNIVFAGGNPNTAKAVLIGEAPGANEDLSGKPFVGKAGQFLDGLLEKAGINRDDDLYIINTLKCRPIKQNEKNNRISNRPPTTTEKKLCSEFLLKQLEFISPSIMILCGNNALKSFLGQKASITKYRGSWFSVNEIKTTAIFHPSYLMQYGTEEQINITIEDLKNIKVIF